MEGLLSTGPTPSSFKSSFFLRELSSASSSSSWSCSEDKAGLFSFLLKFCRALKIYIPYFFLFMVIFSHMASQLCWYFEIITTYLHVCSLCFNWICFIREKVSYICNYKLQIWNHLPEFPWRELFFLPAQFFKLQPLIWKQKLFFFSLETFFKSFLVSLEADSAPICFFSFSFLFTFFFFNLLSIEKSKWKSAIADNINNCWFSVGDCWFRNCWLLI